MTSIHSHIHFNGNTHEAFEFYRSVFGGDFQRIIRFKDLPGSEQSIPVSEHHKIMRIELPIGKADLLMGSDVPAMLGKVSENENRSKILIRAENNEEADRIFQQLSAGGAIEYPMGESPWGSNFGALRDKYGVEWMVEFING